MSIALANTPASGRDLDATSDAIDEGQSFCSLNPLCNPTELVFPISKRYERKNVGR